MQMASNDYQRSLDPTALSLLLAAGADPNRVSPGKYYFDAEDPLFASVFTGVTILHRAAEIGSVGMTKFAP